MKRQVFAEIIAVSYVRNLPLKGMCHGQKCQRPPSLLPPLGGGLDHRSRTCRMYCTVEGESNDLRSLYRLPVLSGIPILPRRMIRLVYSSLHRSSAYQ